MLKNKSNRRLSSLFTAASPDSQEQTSATPPPSSESGRRLAKAVKNRISSATHLVPSYPPPPPPNHARHVSLSNPSIQPVSGHQALDALNLPQTLRVASYPDPDPSSQHASRPTTPGAESNAPSAPTLPKTRRKSRLFGGSQGGERPPSSAGYGQTGPLAWIVGHEGKVSYNLTMLLNGEKVSELWDEEGDTFVYLFPRTSSKPNPSFRIDSSVYAASPLLTRLVHGAQQSPTVSPDKSQLESFDSSEGSRAWSDAVRDEHSEKHLYLPISLSSDAAFTHAEPQLTSGDIDILIGYRNFFAFLIGQSLVATDRHPSIFDVFMRISDTLTYQSFSNVDGSTFGQVAASSFDCYVNELALADIRHSREKTIEAIVLGERMRSIPLYTEGFVHAAGKYDSVKELDSPKFSMISHKTATRLARAAHDLEYREATINGKLRDFEFPNIFAGIMNSATASEGKIVRFKKWKSAFMATRSFTIDYYKMKYGSWLPKAKSKKNDLTTSGLNRLVLLDIYKDMASVYDLLVDRKHLTSRTADGFLDEEEADDMQSVTHRSMRKVLSEYDRSTPPVQPPIPFDLPIYPGSHETDAGDSKKGTKARNKRLLKDTVAGLLRQSHNPDAEQQTPFLEAFRIFESRQNTGDTIEDIWDLRSGQWLFIYAVIQSLPMLVVDAPGVRFTQGVEYFLCQVPRSGVPWGRDDTTRSRTWFGVAGGAQVVSLPTDVVEHGVEGVFRRSHCWRRAQQWTEHDTLLNAAMQELNASASQVPLPPGLLDPSTGARSRSHSPDPRRESIMKLGLEALPLHPDVALPAVSSPLLRPASSSDPNKTFDDILGLSASPGGKSKEKKKKK